MAAATVAIIDRYEPLADGSLHVTGVLTDQLTFKTAFSLTVAGTLTAEQFRRQLISLSSVIDAQATLQQALVPGTAIDLTPPVPPIVDPTPQQVFLLAWAQYQSALRKAAAGIVAVDTPEVLALAKAVTDVYDPAFVGLG